MSSKPRVRVSYYVAAPGNVPTVAIRQQRSRVDPRFNAKDPNYISVETRGVAPCVATVTAPFAVYRSKIANVEGVPQGILSIPELPPDMVIAGEYKNPLVAEAIARDLNVAPIGYRRAS